MTNKERFDALEEKIENCRLCTRLVEYREEIARTKRRAFRDETYWGRPVPGFGDPSARVLIVGLAPGAHGSNRTGRMFTGDASGEFLYGALYRAGFANRPTAVNREDGLDLKDVFITAVGRCAPPDNKPTSEELGNCRPYILAEMDLLPNLQGIVALGKIAYDGIVGILRQQNVEIPEVPFGHSSFAQKAPGSLWLMGAYHPSRQNTQTGRLTVEMYDSLWNQVKDLLHNN
jgi:uracil-DNA glycosylase family 4